MYVYRLTKKKFLNVCISFVYKIFIIVKITKNFPISLFIIEELFFFFA